MNTVLEVKNIIKEYQMGKTNQQTVLNDVSLTMVRGEFISVMGPSGSGKSTLLYSVSGMDKPNGGTVNFCGIDISSLSEDQLAAMRLQKMGFIFQQSNLLKNLNILDNILLSAYLSKRETKKEVNQRAGKLMEQTGISNLAEHDITQASGGQLQRAAICRALINRPEILFGDEPTGALNTKAAGEVMDILSDINEQGTTILLVTHDAKVAARTERTLFMCDGKIVSEMQLGKAKGKDVENRIEKITAKMRELGI